MTPEINSLQVCLNDYSNKSMQQKTLVVYDFDGTITTKDSFIEFLRFVKPGFSFYIHMWLSVPELILYFIGFFDKKQIKQSLLKVFCNKMSQQEFDKAAKQFSDEQIPKMIKTDAMQNILKYQQNNSTLVLLTASPEDYLKDWCKKQNMKLIGTKLLRNNKMFMAKLDGENCFGQEKVRRLRIEFELNDYETRIGYGDTPGDKPFLNLMTEPHYKAFKTQK